MIKQWGINHILENPTDQQSGSPIYLSMAQFQELRQAFRLFDKNNDGYIDAKELVHCTTTLGQKLSPEEVKAFLEEADLDGDGKLNYMEFAKMMTSDD